MIDFQYFYEQSLVVTHKVVNFFIFYLTLILLFPELGLTKITDFLIKQIYSKGEMNSGNISVILIGIVVISFLFEHFSRWFDRSTYFKFHWDCLEFKILIANRALNIFTLMNEDGNVSLTDEVNQSFINVMEPGEENSRHQREFKSYQNILRYLNEYSGTFKLLVVISLIDIFVEIYFLDFKMMMFAIGMASFFILLWFFVNLKVGKTYWKMLQRYWLDVIPKKTGDLTDSENNIYDSLLNKTMSEQLSKEHHQMMVDILNAKSIIL